MHYCSLSVASLALLWFGAAHAQTEAPRTWPTYNRYLAPTICQQQQTYRELDTLGITTNGTLNTETGRQQQLVAAISYQAANGWLLGFERNAKPVPPLTAVTCKQAPAA